MNKMSFVANHAHNRSNRQSDQGVAIAIAVIEWKAAIDNFSPELCRGFLDGEVNHRVNTVVVKTSKVSSVQRVANVQQIGMDTSNHSNDSSSGPTTRSVTAMRIGRITARATTSPMSPPK